MKLISQDKLLDYCEKRKVCSVPLEFIKAESPIIVDEEVIALSQKIKDIAEISGQKVEMTTQKFEMLARCCGGVDD